MPTDNEGQDQKEIKEEGGRTFLSRPWKVFAFEAFLFSLTLLLGIATADKFRQFLIVQKVSLPAISLWQFIFYFLLATSFILLISFFGKFKKGKGVIFKTFFILAVFSGGLIFLSLWIGDVFALILIGTLIFWWFKRPTILVHNLCIILGIAGVGGILGLRLEPQIVIVLLIILSIYDFIAVYKTKHMIKIAKEMAEVGAILALIVPQKISDFFADLKTVKPGGRFLILGGGDVAFPLLLCASLISGGILNSLIVGLFALIGLFVSFYFFISQKIRQPIPALPPIALFSIIGFLLTLILR